MTENILKVLFKIQLERTWKIFTGLEYTFIASLLNSEDIPLPLFFVHNSVSGYLCYMLFPRGLINNAFSS